MDERYGMSVAINNNGSKIAVSTGPFGGNSNSPYVTLYEVSGGDWSQAAPTIASPNAGNTFGGFLQLNNNGDVIAIGDQNQNTVYIYKLTGNSWVSIGSLQGPADSENIGMSNTFSMNDDGTIIAIGTSSYPNVQQKGVVQVYKYSGGGSVWNQLGPTIEGSVANEVLQSPKISGSGKILALSFSGRNSNRGEVEIRRYSNNDLSTGGTWDIIGSAVVPAGLSAQDRIVCSAMNFSGRVIAVGSAVQNNFSGFLNIYAYSKSDMTPGGTWEQIGATFTGEAGDFLGIAVKFSDFSPGDPTFVAIGSTGADYNGVNNVGKIEIYKYSSNFPTTGGTWSQVGNVYGTVVEGGQLARIFDLTTSKTNESYRLVVGDTDHVVDSKVRVGKVDVYTIPSS
jgi:hypothetical protein